LSARRKRRPPAEPAWNSASTKRRSSAGKNPIISLFPFIPLY
jgi:hypothetical protein